MPQVSLECGLCPSIQGSQRRRRGISGIEGLKPRYSLALQTRLPRRYSGYGLLRSSILRKFSRLSPGAKTSYRTATRTSPSTWTTR